MQVKVGPKYQVVIPKEIRRKMKELKPGSKVHVSIMDHETVAIKINPQSWCERTRGIAKEAWKDIDTTKYLEDLRNEWDRKT